MINNLTPEQKSLLSVYRDKWIKIGLSTEPVNFEVAREAAKMAYQAAKIKPPPDSEFYHCRNPIEAAKKAAELSGYKGNDLSSYINHQVYGAQDAGWLSFYDYCLEVLGLEVCRPLKGLIELAKHCGWWAPYREACILQDRPASLLFDDEGRLHCHDGPAVEYRGGLEYFFWRGDSVTREWIDDRNTRD